MNDVKVFVVLSCPDGVVNTVLQAATAASTQAVAGVDVAGLDVWLLWKKSPIVGPGVCIALRRS